MKKSTKRRRAKPKPPIDPLAAQLAEFTKLVMLGANLFYAGTKQVAPGTIIAPPEFSFASQRRGKDAKDKEVEKLPEV